ncbi:MAG: TetR/AcrR family transcriptional regulator [Acidimicrobiia bacterium]|jgi:AcrR family transcriptional regulator
MNTWQEQLADARIGLRHAIQEAAIGLVAELGMPNVSMSAVAEAAGVSRQTLYNHYSDLESIVIDAARTEISAAEGVIAEAIENAPGGAAALEIFVRGTLSGQGDNDVVVSGSGMSPVGEGEVFEMLEPIHQQLRSILRRGIEDGSFRSDLDPDAVSEVMFHMIGSGRRLLHMGRDPQHVVDTVTTLILHSVAV